MFSVWYFSVKSVLVVIWSAPPAKSPGKFGLKVLLTIIFSTTVVGMMSNANALLSGSVDGSKAPLRVTVLYLSDNPLTVTNLSFWIVVPPTLFRVSPRFLSGLFLIDSCETPSIITGLSFMAIIVPDTVSLFTCVVIVTSPRVSFLISEVSVGLYCWRPNDRIAAKIIFSFHFPPIITKD